jgi:hypothetical protein
VLKSVIAIAVLGLAVPLTVLAATGSEPTARTAALAGPGLVSPADDADVEAAPVFSWRKVRRAERYEIQISADPGFRSNILGRRNGETYNTAFTFEKSLADGEYHWRVRAVRSNGQAGSWSRTRTFTKRWSQRPDLLGPVDGQVINFPTDPLILRWDNVRHAARYAVTIAADPSLASPVYGSPERPVETQGTSIAPGGTLDPGQYWWAVTPVDASGHRGTRSVIGSFTWTWPSGTNVNVSDANADPRVFDPLFSWDRVSGAARYEVEVNSSQDFAVGSKVCCSDKALGDSLSPTKLFPNNTYYWRVRAIDANDVSGVWNVGTPFKKAFDDVIPSIPNLVLRDNHNVIATGSTTQTPVVDWDPVPGAASYDWQVVFHDSGGCHWGDIELQGATATTAWTPLARGGDTPALGHPASTQLDKMIDGASYCIRIRARTGTSTNGDRVVSAWSYLSADPNEQGPGFTYDEPVVAPPGPDTVAEPGDYLTPATGTLTTRMPLFTWEHIPGACGYFVVVAKDESFTTIVDVARTKVPAYAPREATQPNTYTDETTLFYWAVVPVQFAGSQCEDVVTIIDDNSPRNFFKESIPPSPTTPIAGADVSFQPTFRWQPAEGYRDYRLQVAHDPSFGSIVDDVTTTSTAYTSSSTYPADALLYWRVRANDEDGVGLTWSPTQTFRRRLPAPQPISSPDRGEQIPVLTWSLVPGAISYDMIIEEPDGDNSNFTFHSTAWAGGKMYGVGTFKWRVRANFPGTGGASTGPYSGYRDFTRVINPPTGAHVTRDNGSLVVRWDSSYSLAEKYRVEFSESSSFTRTLDRETVENTAYAPQLDRGGFQDGGPLYWRVAAVDAGGNVGAWAGGRVRLLKRMVVDARGGLMRGRRGVVEVKVKDAKGRAVRRARVTLRGAGLAARSRRTTRRGIAKFRLTPRLRGTITIRADKGGFRPGSDSLRVR